MVVCLSSPSPSLSFLSNFMKKWCCGVVTAQTDPLLFLFSSLMKGWCCGVVVLWCCGVVVWWMRSKHAYRDPHDSYTTTPPHHNTTPHKGSVIVVETRSCSLLTRAPRALPSLRPMDRMAEIYGFQRVCKGVVADGLQS